MIEKIKKEIKWVSSTDFLAVLTLFFSSLVFFYELFKERLLLTERDLGAYFIPPRFFWVESIKHGDFPLWNRYQFSGHLFFANPQHAILGKIMPYYFYQCDMIPGAEHWRLAIHEAQQLQHDIMGYLPGFATPRLVCDVPFVGKRWVTQIADYDREKGITYWTKNYRTGIEADDPQALTRRYEYYDPVYTLPESGRAWWRSQPRG